MTISFEGLGGQQPEREMLEGYLDWYRGAVDRKVLGLSDEDSRRVMNASGLSPLGVVRHLGYAERIWFLMYLRDEEVDTPNAPGQPNTPQFEVGPDDTVASVLAWYHESIEVSRAAYRDVPLDQVGAREHRIFGLVSLRWMMLHMLEETARHLGHLDLMREEIDGTTGG